eukprot:gene11724-5063_t
MKFCVFVLGEVGRSPRMMYHALSLSKIKNSSVDLIGLPGSAPHPEIENSENINITYLPQHFWNWIPRGNKFLYMLLLPLKVLIQTFFLYWTLFTVNRPDFMLIQTPPAIPTLIIAQIFCFIRGTKLVVDWHNYGWTLLLIFTQKGLSLGEYSPLVWIGKWIEMLSVRYGAHHHFCVSNEMKKDLKKWKINATVLYDKPPQIFHAVDLEEKHKIYQQISTVLVDENEETTRYSIHQTKSDKFILREDRPGLIVSSTSWTKDEDFGILLDAIVKLDELACKFDSFPQLEFVITGKGPEKERYESLMKKLGLKKCRIQTLWLLAKDYPKLLASADLGVCLHYSSSGLDLPMKVVDMLGSGLPVCAINYKTLHELVINGKNGMVFENSNDLSDHLFQLFKDFPVKTKKLDNMKKNVLQFQKYRWDDEWKKKAAPVFK